MQFAKTFFRLPRWSLDQAVSLVLAFILAQASVMYTCYWVGHTEGVRESGGFLTEFPYTLAGLHTVISICLGVCTVGLWIRRAWGLIISALALISVVATYCYWYFMTIKYLRELRNNMLLYSRVQQEVGWFHGATKWDFVVLALVVILLCWHLLTLIKVVVERGRTSTTS